MTAPFLTAGIPRKLCSAEWPGGTQPDLGSVLGRIDEHDFAMNYGPADQVRLLFYASPSIRIALSLAGCMLKLRRHRDQFSQ
jgi:hypothetical protein